jgi:hypothetical protein
LVCFFCHPPFWCRNPSQIKRLVVVDTLSQEL